MKDSDHYFYPRLMETCWNTWTQTQHVSFHHFLSLSIREKSPHLYADFSPVTMVTQLQIMDKYTGHN